jgi:type I restriction enzyme S subunit
MEYPKEWKVKSFEQLFEFKNGVNSDKSSYGEGGVKFINVMEIIYNDYITFDMIPGAVKIREDQKELYSVKNGDILFNRTSETTNEIGLSAVYNGNGEVTFGGFVIRGRPKSKEINNDFKRYCFRADYVRKQIIVRGQGAVRSNIGQADLSSVKVAIPPMIEQQKIATILIKWDELIESQTRLIKAKEKQKTSLMQKLLTGEVRFPGFDDEIDYTLLEEVLDYEQPTKYIVKSTEYSADYPTPVLTAGKTFLLGYTNELDGIFKDDLPVIIFDDFTTANKFVDFPFKVKSSAMKILKPKSSDINIRYIYEIIQTLWFAPTDHKRYWISEYSQLEIPLPSKEEQFKIAEFATSLEIELQSLKDELDSIKLQKKGLMQQLLTGKIRVKV